jgi:hypothetical protein
MSASEVLELLARNTGYILFQPFGTAVFRSTNAAGEVARFAVPDQPRVFRDGAVSEDTIGAWRTAGLIERKAAIGGIGYRLTGEGRRRGLGA